MGMLPSSTIPQVSMLTVLVESGYQDRSECCARLLAIVPTGMGLNLNDKQ